MQPKEYLSIFSLGFLGICFISGLYKAFAKSAKDKNNCDIACGISVYIALVLIGVSQFLEEKESPNTGSWHCKNVNPNYPPTCSWENVQGGYATKNECKAACTRNKPTISWACDNTNPNVPSRCMMVGEEPNEGAKRFATESECRSRCTRNVPSPTLTPIIKTSTGFNLYSNGEGSGCLDGTWSPDNKPLSCPNTLLHQLNPCCKSGVCNKDSSTDGICTECTSDIACNLLYPVVQKIEDIKCKKLPDHFGKDGLFCNNIYKIGGEGDPDYQKKCKHDKDCIITCNNNGVCVIPDDEISSTGLYPESCFNSVTSFKNGPNIKNDDPRIKLCEKKLNDVGDPCTNAKTRLGCTRSSKKYDCYIDNDLILTSTKDCMLSGK